MADLKKTVALMMEKWGSKTLENLRAEALREANGTAFDSLRVDKGPRMFLVVCLTNPSQIQVVGKALNLKNDAKPRDWKTCTVAELLFETEKGVGLSFDELRGSDGECTALVLCATRPESKRTLENLFEFPE